jgi:hypothetical protein
MRELKRYKQELVTLGLLSLLLLAVRWMGLHWFVDDNVLDAMGNVLPGKESQIPNQYDLRSETETVSWTALRMVIYALFAWLGVRITMPEAYKWFKDQFKFETGDGRWQANFVLKLFAIFFFGLVALHMSGAPTQARQCVVASASLDVGVRELTGKNDGPEVERYLAHVHLGKGHAWCAAFVCYHLSECGVPNPRSAWSPAVASAGTQVWTPRKASRSPLPGDVFALYYPSLKRVGHVGFVTGMDGRYITTVEGNTSGPGSREGDGVYARKRELKKLHAITSYIENDATGTARPARTSALRGRRMPHTAIYADHCGATRQPGGSLDTTRYADHSATGQCGPACASADLCAQRWACAQHQWQRYGRAVHSERAGHRALHVRQPRTGAALVGTLPARIIASPKTAHRGGRGNTNAQVGMVVTRHGIAAGPVAAVAPVTPTHQTHLIQ